MNDLKFAFRQLLKNPGFTAVAVFTLALGIGATTAIYSIIDAVLLNPISSREAERLVELGERHYGNRGEPRFGGITVHTLEALRAKEEYFSDIVWLERLDLERKTADFIDEIGGHVVSPGFFNLWNIAPILGRTFSKDEAVRLIEYDRVDRNAVMVLSYSLWQSRFGGQPDVLGKAIEANGCHFTVIGVMPPHFQFPNGNYPSFWVPVENPNPREESGNIQAFGRLKPNVSLVQIQGMLDALAKQLVQEHPAVFDTAWRQRGQGFGVLARPLQHAFTQAPYGAEGLQRTLLGLLAAIGFVLMIACVNIANLMLAKTEQRQQELAVRAAVGASRWRLLRQLFTESALLAFCGALAGLVLAVWGLKVLALLIPENFPRVRPIVLDGSTFAFTLLVTMGTALAFGLAPAWRGSRVSVNDALKRAGASATINVLWRRYRSALVIAEVALSLLLLAGAGLMIDSVIRLLRANPGYDSENLLLVHPGLLRGEKYGVSERSAAIHGALFDEMQRRFAALPGIEAVGIAKLSGFREGFIIDGREDSVGLMQAGIGIGSSDLFRVMRIPLLAGRHFNESDVSPGAATVIVNDAMARLCWPGQAALGKTFRDHGGNVYEVVGVVANARIGLRGRFVDPVEPTFYRPYYEQSRTGGYGPYFVLRSQNDPRALIPAAREIVKSVENSMTAPWFQVARQTFYNATEAQRVYMIYLVVFALVGLLLAALGIYGVLAYSVGRRTREIGLRIALGAKPGHVIAMILSEGGRLVGGGIVVGLIAAFWLTRLLQSQLFEVSSTEPSVFITVVVFLSGVALLACLLPARRAASINPMEALRHE